MLDDMDGFGSFGDENFVLARLLAYFMYRLYKMSA